MLPLQHPPSTGTARSATSAWPPPRREGRAGQFELVSHPRQRLGQVSHCTAQGRASPRAGEHCPGHEEQNTSAEQPSQPEQLRDAQQGAAPAPMPRCVLRVRVWILTVLLESCFPFWEKSRHYLIQNRKQAALWAVSKFGLHSEGGKVKILINPSCWKNALQKHYSEWVTNHKIIIIKKATMLWGH